MVASVDTPTATGNRFRHILLTAVALSTYGGLTCAGALAAPRAGVDGGTVMSFHIPQKPLRDALVELGTQARVRLIFAADSIPNTTVGPLNGTFSVSDAIGRLLGGTGLTFSSQDGAFYIQKATTASITLGPVRVGGTVAHESATGPGVGYVATNTLTGSKTDTPIIEIPNSIHVITKQQMIDQQPQNVMEALRYTPGVHVEGLGGFANGVGSGYNNGSIVQRGFATAQFVDGIRSYSNSAGETAFLERIEVMNGPASVLYGQTTPGGLIGMSLKKPTDTPLRNVTLGFGNWGRYEATFDVSDRVTKSGNVRYRIAGIGVTQGTQTNYIDYHRVGVLPSITWDIDRRTSLTLLGSYMYTPGDGINMTQLPPSVLLNVNGYGRIPRSRFLGDRNWNESGQTDAMFEYQFKHTFNRWIDFNQTMRFESSEFRNKVLMRGEGMVTDQLYSRAPVETNWPSTTIGLDTRVGGKLPVGHVQNTWVVGTDFRQYNSRDSSLTDDTPGNNGYPGLDGYTLVNVYNPQSNYVPCMDIHSSKCLVSGYQSHQSYFQEGIYFQDQLKYRGLSVILGGRQDWVDYHGYTAQTSNENATHTYTYTRTSALPRPQAAFTWRAGLVYQFKFGLAPYFSYSTSFVPQSSRNWQGNLFPPLTGKQLEAGVKYQSPDHKIFLQAAAFRIEEDHYLITDPDHPNFSADAGRVRSQGFELSANANFTRDLRFMASYTYDAATYLSTNLTSVQKYPNGTTGDTVSQKGKYIGEGIPRNMASAFLDYTLPSRYLKGFGINGGVRYNGFTYSDDVNSFKVPAYILFDIGAHYDFGQATPILKGLRGQLSISNLTNKYYITSCGGTYSCYIGQGRRVYGNLSYSW
ncbi:hypothetical protein GLUCOINTEAF2_0202670 [Komagataeibacter intermedius AF2]|uniref:Secretin/TonB short N-terminal domain-containing protein n=1 Tax=Komagataeibacter intermedius AF2 TaxID=1458464 RepID=A0A0N0MEL1_9PROT|nr:TonB-dependent siderophore receptor [Komagataeibacter intermedius]KPH86573.1 hypothetical protein GLUCOINTEAF2_0202670 [Komagataeibacter intermedius AF2]